MPSTEPEPFGLVALEAMLASKPVVGANHGGLTEIIVEGETGFLVEPNSEDDLKAALLRLILDKKLRKDFGCEANKRAQLQFSLKKYVDDFLKLYQ